MAANNNIQAQWRPQPTGNHATDEAMRKAFDFIYELQGRTGGSAPGNNLTTIINQQTFVSGGGGGGGGGNNGGNSNTSPMIFSGSRVSMASIKASLNPNALFVTTDWNNTVYWSDSVNWQYLEGTYGRNQNQVATLSGTLNTFDDGLLVHVLDFDHILQWIGNNNAWRRGPGDWEIADSFHMLGSAPAGNGWHACNGANVSYLIYNNAGTGTRTLPNLVGNNNAAFAKMGNNYNGTVVPAVNPTLVMNPYTPTGNVSANFTGSLDTTSNNSAGTPSGNISATFSGDSFTFPSSGMTPPPGNFMFSVGPETYTPTGNVSAIFIGDPLSTMHSHTVTPTGNVSATFTGNNATLTGNISLPGDPVPEFVVIAYYRQ